MLEAAVIGAGAAGLVGSRHLLGQGLRPSIFDATESLGGGACWNTDTGNGKMWKNGMHTNLSNIPVTFPNGIVGPKALLPFHQPSLPRKFRQSLCRSSLLAFNSNAK